jgi:putative membrane protein
MSAEATEEKPQKRILILCVDRDGDLGTKAEIKTPLLGKDANLNAAVALALKDPEEPDANAMFEAIRVYDRLKNEAKPEEVFEIATISGSELGGVGADRKVVAELCELMNAFPAGEVILVTDGYSDEAVLPLVESRVPVSSVRRIVVKHSESIEETAAILTRYVRALMENPRYSRLALGLPGLLLLILVIFAAFNLLYLYWLVFLFVFSAALLVKGFGVDKSFKNFIHWVREYSPPPLPWQISNYSAIAGGLCIAVGVYLGGTSVANNVSIPFDLAVWLSNLPNVLGYFIRGSMDLLVVGICVVLFGRAILWYFERDIKLLRNVALIITVAWSRWILEGTADVLILPQDPGALGKLIFSVIVGILIGIASILVVLVIHRSAKGFFARTKEQVGEFEEG